MEKRKVSSAIPSSTVSAGSSTKPQEEAEAVRRQLLDAVSRDDVLGVQQLCRRVAELDLTLTDAMLRDPADRATVLHTALIHDRWNVAADLIRSTADEQLLDATYDITGQRFVINLAAGVGYN